MASPSEWAQDDRMKKVALVFVLAVFVPSLALAWLAVRSMRDQQFILERYGDGGGIPADVYNVAGQQTSQDGQSVKLFGDLGPIDGARFARGRHAWRDQEVLRQRSVCRARRWRGFRDSDARISQNRPIGVWQPKARRSLEFSESACR